MTINLQLPDIRELKPRIVVFGVGGAGGNAVNNMIESGLNGVDFVVANTDAQALTLSRADHIVQMGLQVTEGLGAGSQPEIGRAAAEEVIDELRQHLAGVHMVFITAGMGGGTGTGAAPVLARVAREMGILTVGVVTKPFHFEGQRRMTIADQGIHDLMQCVDTLIVIPNQNLFRVANEKTTFADAFALADQVLYSGVACITDLMVKEGLINLDFADVRSIMRGMGKAMMGTGEAVGEKRAISAAEQAIANPLLDDVSMRGAKGVLISITGGRDMTLYEVDEAATRIREEVDQEANIILGATFDESLEGRVRVSVVATGIEMAAQLQSGMNNPLQSALSMRQRPAVTSQVRAQDVVPQPMSGSVGLSSQAAMAPMVSTTSALGVSSVGVPAAGMMPSQASSATAPLTSGYAQQVGGMAAPASSLGMTQTVMQAQPQVQTQAQLQVPVTQAAVAVASSSASLASAQSQPTSFVQNGAFIPPVADRVMKPVQMPSMDELTAQQRQATSASSMVQQSQPHADLMQPQPAEKRRMTLLEKLSKVGFGRSGEETAQDVPSSASVKAAPTASVSSQASASSYRPAAGHLDTHGRVQAQKPVEDDALEIPAFLRRNS